MVVGDLVPAVIQQRDGERGGREYLRLVDPDLVWLCPRCVADPTVLQRLKTDWNEGAIP